MLEDIQKQRFMEPHSQQKNPWVVSLRNLKIFPQLKVGPNEPSQQNVSNLVANVVRKSR